LHIIPEGKLLVVKWPLGPVPIKSKA